MPNGVIIGVVLKHLCGKKMQQRQEANVDIEVGRKVICIKFTALNIRILYIKLSLNTLRWDGLCDGKEGG